jgi:hypothetical protein
MAERTGEIAERDLTVEQRGTLALLNKHLPDILKEFDAVLARYGIKREVHNFKTSRLGLRKGSCQMVCCQFAPPDEACAGECTHPITTL